MILRSHLRLKIISLGYKKRQTCFISTFETGLSMMVLVTGLEPVRSCPRGILSPLRLPISPHQPIF
jgi:hypothetical protein